MSRAYRIRVEESIRRVIRGSDHVGTRLELLELLPKEQMAELLVAELEQRGFVLNDGQLVREEKGVTITVDADTGEVRVCAEVSQEIELTQTGSGYADTDQGRRGRTRVESKLREQVKKDLEASAQKRTEQLTDKATDALEQALRDLQPELDAVINRVTSSALKRKAAQLGEIKSVDEDIDNGSMTIVVEV